MSGLKDYFNTDFKSRVFLGDEEPLTGSVDIEYNKEIRTYDFKYERRCILPDEMTSKFFTFYIYDTPAVYHLIVDILNHQEDNKRIFSYANVGIQPQDITLGKVETEFSNRVYFYVERDLDQLALKKLDELSKSKNLLITIRGSYYLKYRLEMETPQAFISHDWNDKEIARQIAIGLSSRACTVWFDEYSLKIGDNLKESFEKGIDEAKKCVVILSKNYLENRSWAKKEFDSIFTKELVFNQNIILPIWVGVTPEELYKYSSTLPLYNAAIWPSRDEEKSQSKSELIISELHKAILS